jgi:tetratricopeptide (TPR) repeat protein
LLDEVELREAEEWLSEHGGELGASADLRALIQASRTAFQEAEQQKEAARQRDLRQAQALATAERRRVRNLAGSLVIVALLLLVTLGAALFAWSEYTDLKKARDDQRRQHAESYARLATEAIKRGDWKVALEASAEALNDSSPVVPDEIELRLVRVKALVALNLLEEANKELSALATRADLGRHEGSVRLWQADFRSERDGDTKAVLDLVHQAQEKGLEGSEKDYAAAWLADSVPEAIRQLHSALDKDPMNERATAMLVTILFWTKDFQKCRELITPAEVFFSEGPTFKICHAVLSARVGDREDAASQLESSKHQLSKAQFATAQQMVDLALEADQLDRDMAKLAATDPNWLTLQKRATDSLELSMRAMKLGQSLGGRQGLARDLMLGSAPPVVKKGIQRVGSLTFRIGLIGLPWGLGGDSNRLLEDVTDATRLYPDGMLYLMKGWLLEEKGRLAEAKLSYQLASVTPSMVVGSYCRLTGLCLLAFAQTGAGKQLPKDPQARREAVQTLKELVRDLSGPQGILPEQAVTASTHAMVLNENELALWIIREGERHGPENLDLLRQRLLAEQRTGNWPGAIETARKILALKPKDPAATTAHDRAVERLRTQVRDLLPLTSKVGPP